MFKKKRSQEDLKKQIQEFREGEKNAASGFGSIPDADPTSGDEVSSADTVAFPSYIDKEGNVKHKGPRKAVGEQVIPGDWVVKSLKKGIKGK